MGSRIALVSGVSGNRWSLNAAKGSLFSNHTAYFTKEAQKAQANANKSIQSSIRKIACNPKLSRNYFIRFVHARFACCCITPPPPIY
mmetsp:Transcript_134210/g.233019  ORF Transcript_134210/g.233019 Transcript_134210/m.233019 type:complete len:87 (+) Transcript_134210:152-412(+)